jgi:DNA ligase-4
MGFQFPFLCDLLAKLDNSRTAKASTAARKENPDIRIVAQWFARHERGINEAGTDKVALLSCMFPEKRTDRVYYLQTTLLSRVIGRCLGLGSSRLSELNRWQSPGNSDLGQCVENVMRQAENPVPAGQELSVEEIDRAMAMIASRCRFSGPQVRRNRTAVDIESTLSPLYRRLSSRDAKWLTRMILKNYSPVIFPEQYTLKMFHFLLPHLLMLQNSFDGALEMLASDPINHFPPNPDPRSAKSLSIIAMQHLRPRAGIKVGRPEYYKARSIKHCHQMANGRRMSIERKYDGEYCQIHIDMSNKHAPIQIFSKSGKDSTADRDKVIPVIEEALRMRHPHCKFTQRCILEGELLVWSDKDRELMDFNKLRRLLPRSGILIGVDNDSPYALIPPGSICSCANWNRPQPYEHLMIMFFDILLLDDDICLAKPHRERRLLLQNVVQKIPGRAELAHQEVLDFSRIDSYHRLEKTFAKAITQRWEGYVLKASDEPYFPIYSTGVDTMFGRWIKLKKDYIPGLGDTVDLALIGASYKSQDAQSLSHIKKLKWTHFFVGCLLNKDAVQKEGSIPHFRVIDVLGRHSMSIQTMRILNQFGEFYARSPENFEGFAVEYGHNSLPNATTLFKQPFVVEMLGSGFEKPSGARYFALRFPRILKIHSDRTVEESASFRELQILAENARALTLNELEEREKWSKRLEVGSGLVQHIGNSSDPEATCSDTESEPTSPASPASVPMAASTDSYMDAYPLTTTLVDGTQRGHQFDQSHKDHSSVHLVYIDETIPNIDIENTVCESNVLVDNQNLSCCQSSSQRDVKTASQKSENLSTAVRLQKTLEPTVSGLSSPMRATNLYSAHRKYTPDTPETEPPILKTETSLTSLKRKIYPQSPLTTIPLWMPELSLKSFALPDSDLQFHPDMNTDSLRRFVQSLGSNAVQSALQQSNPYAASQGTRFGIILFDPNITPLGKEMHRVVTTLATTVHQGRASLASIGNIFFLSSSILTRDLRPEDLRFCLRTTWSQIGGEHYYGCISWDLSRRPIGSVADRVKEIMTLKMSFPDITSGVPDHRDFASNTGPWIKVTFDDSDVAVLGEYVSVEPLVHARYV